MTSTQTAVTFPEGRYGRRRDPAYQRRRRWLSWVAGGLVVLAGMGVAARLYQQYADPLYAVSNINVTDLTDTGVTVDFDVRVPAGEGASCTVQGHTRFGQLVGDATVDVPPAGAGVTSIHVTYSLATTERPVTGEVPGCGPR
jgi:hypothetical protein